MERLLIFSGKDSTKVDRSGAYPWENVKALAEAGLMGMTIPKEYGGGGASSTSDQQVLKTDGDVAACVSSTTADEQPPEAIDAMLRDNDIETFVVPPFE